MPKTDNCDGREATVILLEEIVSQAKRDPTALRVLYALMFEALGPIAELHLRFVEFHAEMRADLALLVKKGVRDGSILRRTPPQAEAALIVGALRGIAYQWRLDPDGFDPVPALRYLAATTGHRLGPPT